MKKYEIEFIFSEFGTRLIANQPFNDELRLDPTYSSIAKYFPDAKIKVYTDNPLIINKYPNIDLNIVNVSESPFPKNNLRWGWHCCDYYQAKGLLDSSADIAISVDSDLFFYSNEILSLIPIIDKFGICVPTNPRQLVKIDGIHTRENDGDYYIGEDESMGNFLTYDLWWMGLKTNYETGRNWLKEFCRLMELNPKRGPLQLSRASWNLGIYPYSMPKQWGVGSDDLNCGQEIILHLGHKEVLDHYFDEIIDNIPNIRDQFKR